MHDKRFRLFLRGKCDDDASIDDDEHTDHEDGDDEAVTKAPSSSVTEFDL